MKKIKLFLSIILISLLIFKILSNISFGAMSNDGKLDIIEKLGYLKAGNVISAATYDYMVNKVSASNYANGTHMDDNYFIFIGKGTRYNGGGHNWSKLNTTEKIYIVPIDDRTSTVSDYTNDTSNSLYTTWTGSSNATAVNTANNSGGIAGNYGYNDALDGFYVYSTKPISTRLVEIDAYEEYGGTYLPQPFNVTFTPTSLASSVAYSGDYINVVRVGRSVNNWNLGYFSSNFKDCKQFNVYLAPVVYIDSNSMISDGTYASSIYYKNVGINNQNKLSLGDNGYVSIPNNYIYYNQLYILSYNGFDNDGEEITSGQLFFYFKTIDSDTSIGSLINPDTTTDIDIAWINSLGNFWENSVSTTSGDANYFYNNIWGNMSFSGDFFSGDLLNEIGFIDYTDNEYDLFIYRIFKKVTDAIYNDSEDITLSFNYRGNVYNISSSDLTVPSSPLKTFVTTFLTAGFIYLIIYRFHVWFVMITTVDVFSFLHSFNTDESMFL